MKVRPKAPCLNCQNRKIGCHDICEKYQIYRREQDDFNLFYNAEKNFERVMDHKDFIRRRRCK